MSACENFAEIDKSVERQLAEVDELMSSLKLDDDVALSDVPTAEESARYSQEEINDLFLNVANIVSSATSLAEGAEEASKIAKEAAGKGAGFTQINEAPPLPIKATTNPYEKGDKVLVFSRKLKTWCEGEVLATQRNRAVVQYRAGKRTLKKSLPCDSDALKKCEEDDFALEESQEVGDFAIMSSQEVNDDADEEDDEQKTPTVEQSVIGTDIISFFAPFGLSRPIWNKLGHVKRKQMNNIFQRIRRAEENQLKVQSWIGRDAFEVKEIANKVKDEAIFSAYHSLLKAQLQFAECVSNVEEDEDFKELANLATTSSRRIVNSYTAWGRKKKKAIKVGASISATGKKVVVSELEKQLASVKGGEDKNLKLGKSLFQ